MEKPIDPEVLAVKVKALIQRTYDKEAADCLLLSGGITIDKNARKVFSGPRARGTQREGV